MITAMFNSGDFEMTVSMALPMPNKKGGANTVLPTWELWCRDTATGREYKKEISGENNAYMQFCAIIAADDVGEIAKAWEIVHKDAGLTGLIP